MKKGFTLIELLIVMVIVGILVAVALPKYYSSMERGRATEGIANLKAASDWVNAQYVINGNSYPAASDLTSLEVTNSGASRTVIGFNSRSVYFTTPGCNTCDPANDDGCCTSTTSECIIIQTKRKQGDEEYYTLTAHNGDGELLKITCTGTQKELCEPLGMTLNGSQYEVTF